jgi:hypothetical protein
VQTVKRGYILRIQSPESFRLRWSEDDWKTFKDTDSNMTALGVEFVDISIPTEHGAGQGSIRFTFFRPASNSWEGSDYLVSIV